MLSLESCFVTFAKCFSYTYSLQCNKIVQPVYLLIFLSENMFHQNLESLLAKSCAVALQDSQ